MRLCHPDTMQFERHVNGLVIMAACRKCRTFMGRLSRKESDHSMYKAEADWASFWTINKMFKEMMCLEKGIPCTNCKESTGECMSLSENGVARNG